MSGDSLSFSDSSVAYFEATPLSNLVVGRTRDQCSTTRVFDFNVFLNALIFKIEMKTCKMWWNEKALDVLQKKAALI